MIPIAWYLIFSAALFCIGLFGALARKNAVAILMGIELMLNAVNVNLVAFWHYYAQIHSRPYVNGLAFTTMVFVVAAAEVAVGLALVISAYRRRQTPVVDELTLLKG